MEILIFVLGFLVIILLYFNKESSENNKVQRKEYLQLLYENNYSKLTTDELGSEIKLIDPKYRSMCDEACSIYLKNNKGHQRGLFSPIESYINNDEDLQLFYKHDVIISLLNKRDVKHHFETHDEIFDYYVKY